MQVAHAPGMPGTFSPAADFKGNRWLAIPACITARAWRTCRDACRDRLPAVTGKTFPASRRMRTRKCAYLVKGTCYVTFGCVCYADKTQWSPGRYWSNVTLIAKFVGPTWSPSGADRTHKLCYLSMSKNGPSFSSSHIPQEDRSSTCNLHFWNYIVISISNYSCSSNIIIITGIIIIVHSNIMYSLSLYIYIYH